MLIIDEEICIGCGVCVTICPTDSMSVNDQGIAEYKKESCIECFECIEICVQDAISRSDD
ncbi:MAG: 4Fe-4S binding protein [Halanaerobiales bacterium]|nr:4Fe-4S binding protein [Halanaerobiales bacterium]